MKNVVFHPCINSCSALLLWTPNWRCKNCSKFRGKLISQLLYCGFMMSSCQAVKWSYPSHQLPCPILTTSNQQIWTNLDNFWIEDIQHKHTEMDRQLTFEILLYLNIFFTTFYAGIEAFFLLMKYIYVTDYGNYNNNLEIFII